ncbi:MAG TPA: prolyl oligopeptidase family serine peptidase [Nitrososphaerales archaeon]|nr:prolyl oligopeptidase family serine peptidase [Nitrososphaerales archaeon]
MNPEHVLVASNRSGISELYAYDLRTDSLRQATNRPSGTIYGMISPDGRHIYYLDDKKGNETGHLVRVPFEGGGSPKDMTPDLPEYSLVDPFVDGTGSHLGVTIPGPDGFDAYVIDTAGGSAERPRMINRSKKAAFGPVFSTSGETSVVASTERFGGQDFSLISIDTGSGRKLCELADESSRVEPSDFSPVAGDQRMLASSNGSGVMRPLLWDARRGVRTDLEVRGVEGDIEGMGWSPDAGRVLLCQTDRATTRLWVYDLNTASLSKVSHPEGAVGAACFLTDDSILMSWQDSVNPSQLLILDLKDSSAPPSRRLAPGDLPKSHPWRTAHFRSSDGQEIQCWYATPDGKGPFATILETHGGPTAAQFNAFAPRSQAWLDHGFAYASVNYRGSTTFGKEFEKKIIGDVGHWEVEDMVSAREWLVRSGIAKPDEVLLTGWSYGGYLTLHAMGVYPDLWAGGMGGVVVADWVAEYEDEPEAMRGYDVAFHGGTPKEKMDSYVRASPINYVEKLAAPLLIIQGKSDVRCPPRQVELYEAKARALGKRVKVVWYETGHAGSRVNMELSISHQEIMLNWARDVLAAKNQSMSRRGPTTSG